MMIDPFIDPAIACMKVETAPRRPEAHRSVDIIAASLETVLVGVPRSAR